LDASGGLWTSLTLSYRPPYDWDSLARFLMARAIEGVEVATPRHYARSIRLGEEIGLLSVSPGPDNALRVEIWTLSPPALPEIIARVRRLFDLDADPAAIEHHLGADPLLAPMVASRRGLRVPGAWDGFELAVRAVLGQQITVGAAVALAGRLARDFGEVLPEALRGKLPGVTRLFPTPSELGRADLSALPMPRARSAALGGLARAAMADPRVFAPCRGLEVAIPALTALSGIGEWTAHYIAMRALREADAFPAADVGLMRAASRPGAPRPTAAELLSRAEAWRPWRAYAAMHLWASLSSSELNGASGHD